MIDRAREWLDDQAVLAEDDGFNELAEADVNRMGLFSVKEDHSPLCKCQGND